MLPHKGCVRCQGEDIDVAHLTHWKTTLGLTVVGLTLAGGFSPAARAEGPFETLDIVFIFDSSGSIGASDWQIEIDLAQALVQSARPADSRIGIIQFANEAWLQHEFIDDQTESGILATVDGLTYTEGQSNMLGALQESIDLYGAQSAPENDKLIMMITDGTTYFPGGDSDVCQVVSTLRSLDIHVVIIGVGSAWTTIYVECLVEDETTDIALAADTGSEFFDFDRFRTKIPPPCFDIDGDGFGFPGSAACTNGPAEDCDDDDSDVYPFAPEPCDDGLDNDCDLQIDCDDTDCAADPACIPDGDGDGVGDNIDVCPTTPAGTLVDTFGRPVGDFDTDCDTDLNDFAAFMKGFTGMLP